MKEHFLTIQYPYDYIELALCSSSNIIEQIKIDKCEAIKLLIPSINSLLVNHNLKLQDLICIGINRGPAPYNTLRSIIATLNGLHFIHKIRFVELDALSLLLENQPNNTIALLNAFAQRVFYAIKVNDQIVKNICTIADLAKILHDFNLSNIEMNCVGNGAIVYEKELTANLPYLKISSSNDLFNSLALLTSKTYQAIQEKKFSTCYIEPIYFN
jgi:tRNA A37 threonylcarbamoyladenosine modification protein TsaB